MAHFFKSADGAFLATLDGSIDAPAGFELLSENTVDAAVEKHVPAVDLQRDGHIIRVAVGEVEHPMTDDHFIQWIALEADDRLEVHYLKPGNTPVTFFAGGVKTGSVFAYCNLHGLWKASF